MVLMATFIIQKGLNDRSIGMQNLKVTFVLVMLLSLQMFADVDHIVLFPDIIHVNIYMVDRSPLNPAFIFHDHELHQFESCISALILRLGFESINLNKEQSFIMKRGI